MTPFKRASAHYGETPSPITPYQRAAQAWDDRIGSARVQARNWRLIALLSVATTAGLACALVVQSARGTITPWIVEVDERGARLTWRRDDGGRCMVSAISLSACAEARAAVAVGIPLVVGPRFRPAPDPTDGRGS